MKYDKTKIEKIKKTQINIVSAVLFIFLTAVLSSCTGDGFDEVIKQENLTASHNASNLPDAEPFIPDRELTTEININGSVSLNWVKAADDYTPTENLRYRVFYAETSEIDTIESAVANGNEITPGGDLWAVADISSIITPAMTRNKNWHFNVFVRDSQGGISRYSVKSVFVPVSQPALPGGNGLLVLQPISSTNGYLLWIKSSDDATPESDIQYQIFRSTDQSTIAGPVLPSTGSFEQVTPGWTVDIAQINIPTGGVTNYYYNVFVRDEDGSISSYQPLLNLVPGGSLPLPGGSGTITAAPKAAKKIDIVWLKASDFETPQNELMYTVFSSLNQNEVADYAQAVNDAKNETTWTADISTIEVKAETNNTIYWFNVFVKDADGNISAYTPVSAISGE